MVYSWKYWDIPAIFQNFSDTECDDLESTNILWSYTFTVQISINLSFKVKMSSFLAGITMSSTHFSLKPLPTTKLPPTIVLVKYYLLNTSNKTLFPPVDTEELIYH